MKRSAAVRLAALAGLAGAAVVAALLFPVRETLQAFLGWLDGLGPWGPIVLAAAYVPACVFFVPGSLLTLGAGFAFGVVRGTIAVSAGSVAGVCAAFLVARTLARPWVEQWIGRKPRFQALDRAVAREGFKIVLLTRLSPIFPFNVLNYAFGLTRVRFRDYLLASWIGMLPGTVMYVYLGSAVQSLADLASGRVQGGSGQKWLFFLGLLATVAVTVVVTRLARRALKEAAPEVGAPVESARS